MTLLKLTFCVTFLLLTKASFGQADYKHPVKSLQDDFKILKGALEESHAGIYWYTPKHEMDNYFEDTYSLLDHDMTELEFFRTVAPLISKVGCGHTWIATSEVTQDKIWGKGKVLPLKLKFIKRKAYCLQNNSYDSISLQQGDEVLSINNLTIDSLVSLSNKFSPGDGFIEIGKNIIIDNVFNQFYTLYVEQPDEYVVKFIDRHGNVKEIVIEPRSLKEIELTSKRRYHNVRKRETNNIELNLSNNASMALLRIKEFADWTSDGKKITFPTKLRECFQKMDSSTTRNLIIDLRDNDGGNEKYGLLLYSYLTDKEFIGYKKIDFRTTRFSYRKYSNTSWFQYMLFKALLKHRRINDSTFLLTNDKATRLFDPDDYRFKGKIYILINRGSFSTTSDVTALAHSNKIATFVGEETGGSYLGNTSNYLFLITLPNTKIKVNIPIARYQTNVISDNSFGRGTIPDYEVEYSIHDIINSVDREMETVLELIRN